jgi:ABC-type multidrug transport system ATPase subunit
MRKVYPSPVGNKVAVQCLSFGIPKGECFGFLGINGAGKTTTLSILSGEFPPTSGTAFIDGYNIQLDQSKIRRKIGYCPQFDALLELLTVREHLELYGRIKGMEGEDLERVVRGKLEQMDLTDFENKAAGSLSGGNKRKLSVAIAMIGEPSIVFLDEVPSPPPSLCPPLTSPLLLTALHWNGSSCPSFHVASDQSYLHSRCLVLHHPHHSLHGPPPSSLPLPPLV